jgi:hypothetical protein
VCQNLATDDLLRQEVRSQKPIGELEEEFEERQAGPNSDVVDGEEVHRKLDCRPQF